MEVVVPKYIAIRYHLHFENRTILTKANILKIKSYMSEVQSICVVRKNEGKRINVFSTNQTIKLSGLETQGKYTLIEQVDEPGTGIPMHTHANEDEMFTVLEGEITVYIGEEKHVLTKGDIASCPRGVPHSWNVSGKSLAKLLVVITPSGLEHMFEELGNYQPEIDGMDASLRICKKYGVTFQ